MTRTDVTFPSGDTSCAAWIYRPAGSGRVPVIVMAHGLAGVKEMRLDAFAERFTAAGYACLVFDYRHFGASGGEPRQLLDIAAQRADWRAAVAFARAQEGLDGDRVVLWGTSFSGGHVIVVGAEDPRVAAVVSQCPFTDGPASSLRIPPLTSLRLGALAARDLGRAARGREPLTVPSYGPPGSVALMSAPDSEPGVRALLPHDAEERGLRSDVAARFALQINLDRPGRLAHRLACPALFVVCDRDTVAPPGPTLRHVARAPQGTVVRVPEGHFDIYVGQAFERNVATQLEFLAQHVPVA